MKFMPITFYVHNCCDLQKVKLDFSESIYFFCIILSIRRFSHSSLYGTLKEQFC